MHFADKWVLLFYDVFKLNVISDDEWNHGHVSHQMLTEFEACGLLEALMKILSSSTDSASLSDWFGMVEDEFEKKKISKNVSFPALAWWWQ